MNRPLFALASFAAILSSPVPAQSVRPASPTPATQQPIARAAFIATMDGDYRRLDANKDNMVTRAEVEANQRRIFAAASTARAKAQFARIDADRNGQISPAEFMRAAAVPPQKVDVTRQMGRLDANRDSKVTLVEYRTLTVANFDRLDADKDGVLTVAEQRAGGFGR